MSWNVGHTFSGIDMPIMESQQEEIIYNVMDGKKWAVSSIDIAQRNVEYYAKQGKECSIKTEIKTVGYERVIHSPSGIECNEQ
jgi:hypothetical protein